MNMKWIAQRTLGLAFVAAAFAAGCGAGVEGGDEPEGSVGEAQQDLVVGTSGATEPAAIVGPGDYYTDYINLLYGGTCTFKTTLGTLKDSVMWVYNASTNKQLGFNDDADGTLGSRVDLALDPGSYYVKVGGYANAYTGAYTLS